ncbi:MAG: nicotinate (nicotinamide) nucleotide adenylyltransferase [Oscillospiraceae bacterium]|nr:nicotinate (nicotinamide) nucleotide adenylyltransferase [Oscillospiraceae bacterium]
MRIGIFGGTFNPPHIGHFRGAKAAVDQLALDKLIIIPAGIPPHKSLPEDSPSAQMRLHMTRGAFQNIAQAEISDMEIFSEKPIYTSQTVAKLKEQYPDAQMFLLVGTDMYLTLETWKDSSYLLSAVIPAVFSRGAMDLQSILEHSQKLKDEYNIETEIVQSDAVEISSSQLRQQFSQREGIGYITDTNYSYIISNRLYGAKADWDWLRERSLARLDSRRVAHVKGCEIEAIALAKRWAVDIDDAREAAILHDITKMLSLEENIKVFSEHGITPTEVEIAEEKLMHAKTGALLAKSEFGVSDAVFDAIYCHTTGKVDMSDLEKIIFIADFIEVERDFPGVEELRKVAYENLNEAMILGLKISLQDLYDNGITPNPLSQEALDFLLGT